MSQIIFDATGLHTCHRTRGIGRYVKGLLSGFSSLKEKRELGIPITVLRSGEFEEDYPFETILYKRNFIGFSNIMYVENKFRLDSQLPKNTLAYHGTAMEGYSKKYPWIATCHDLIPLLHPEKYLPVYNLGGRAFWTSYKGRLKEKAAHIIAISNHVKSTLIENFGFSDQNISVSYHGIDPFWFEKVNEENLREELFQFKEEDYFLFIGGFDPRKNFDILVKAIAKIGAENFPTLVVAGHRPPDVLKRHAELKELENIKVVFLEYLGDQELLFLYRNALALLFPSIEEGWGFPIVEAFASGTPVLCGNFGSMAEASNGLGIYCDVNSQDEISEAMLQIIEGREDQSRRDSRINWAKSLSWEENAKRTVKIYKQFV